MFAATFAVSFTACTDDLMVSNDLPVDNVEPQGELYEAYGLTYQDFNSPSDVVILNADTTEISVSKDLADKLGIATFVNHPLGIWHQIEQLPYARKATAEKLVGDRYILTVEPATLAELIGEKRCNSTPTSMLITISRKVPSPVQEASICPPTLPNTWMATR